MPNETLNHTFCDIYRNGCQDFIYFDVFQLPPYTINAVQATNQQFCRGKRPFNYYFKLLPNTTDVSEGVNEIFGLYRNFDLFVDECEIQSELIIWKALKKLFPE